MEKKRLLELLKSEPNKVDAIGMILSNYTDFGHTEKGGMVSVAQFKKVAECILEWSESQKAETSDKPSINYEPLLTPVIYKQSFIDRFNKYFEYKPKTYEYIGKNSKRRYTLDDLHKEYEKAMGETPFNRG